MNAIQTTSVLLALTVYVHAQQASPAENLAQKPIEELRQIAKGLGGGKSSGEFVDAAYASGRDDFVALCWSMNTCSHFCWELLRKSKDPVFRDKQVLMMLRNSSGWSIDEGLSGGSQIVAVVTLRNAIRDYLPALNDHLQIGSYEERLALADKLEVLMKAKREQAQAAKSVPGPTVVPAPLTPPAPVKASTPQPPAVPAPAPAVTATQPRSSSPPWSWISAGAALLLVIAFLSLRRKS